MLLLVVNMDFVLKIISLFVNLLYFLVVLMISLLLIEF